MYSFNVICTTLGRNTLGRLLDSVVNQLSSKDYLTIISDYNHEFVQNTLSMYNFKCSLSHLKNEQGPTGGYGHRLLNTYMNSLDGDYIMFADDDDRYTEGAFEVIRNTVKNKKTLYIFKHKWYGTINWTVRDFTLGNVGKCMGVIPNTKDLPSFREDVLGDVYFYEDLSKKFESEFVDHIIYKVRDTDLI